MYQTDIDKQCQGNCNKCRFKEICDARKLSLLAEETVKRHNQEKSKEVPYTELIPEFTKHPIKSLQELEQYYEGIINTYREVIKGIKEEVDGCISTLEEPEMRGDNDKVWEATMENCKWFRRVIDKNLKKAGIEDK